MRKLSKQEEIILKVIKDSNMNAEEINAAYEIETNKLLPYAVEQTFLKRLQKIGLLVYSNGKYRKANEPVTEQKNILMAYAQKLNCKARMERHKKK